MKYLHSLFTIFIISCIPAFSQSTDSCDTKTYLDSCRIHIENDHFTDIKEFSIRNKKGSQKQIEHSFTFTAGTTYEYYFTGYQEGQQQIVASLLNNKKKEIATNHPHNEYLHKITFDCEKTGIYYIKFTFMDDEEFCGAAVLGFTKGEKITKGRKKKKKKKKKK